MKKLVNLLFLLLLSVSTRYNIYSLLLSFFLSFFFQLDATRSGEWGDHVTLQAAADRVSFLLKKRKEISCLVFTTRHMPDIVSSLEQPASCKISHLFT